MKMVKENNVKLSTAIRHSETNPSTFSYVNFFFSFQEPNLMHNCKPSGVLKILSEGSYQKIWISDNVLTNCKE